MGGEGVHDHRENLTPTARPKGSSSRLHCRITGLVSAGGVGIAAELSSTRLERSMFPLHFGVLRIDHMDLYPPLPAQRSTCEGHVTDPELNIIHEFCSGVESMRLMKMAE